MTNWLNQIIRKVFPPPRRPVTWRAATPLAVFAVLMLIFMLRVTIAGDMDFDSPWAFLLLLVTPWVWWMHAAGHSGLAPSRSSVAAFVRLVVVGLLIIVLAMPRAVKTSNRVAVVFDVDISDSVLEQKDEAFGQVMKAVESKEATDEAGMVVFGGTAAVEYPPRTATMPFEGFINSEVRKDATNLQQSLSLSAAMLPDDAQARVVLVSDGTETRGDLKQAITELQSRDISVDVLQIKYDESERREVILERLDMPRNVRLGESYETASILSSNYDGNGTLVLTQNGEIVAEQSVSFRKGKNRISVPIQVESPGYYEYEARIKVATKKDDGREENNAVRNYLYIEGPGRILIVTDPLGDSQEYEPLKSALEDGKREVEIAVATDFPLDPLSLMPYDVVIFADVPSDAFFPSQIRAMHDAVRDLGIGFAMLGGPNSFGPGGYQNSPVEDCLPVSMEISKRKVLPKGALVIILHTCEFPQGNTWAKRITKEAIKVLNSEDDVGAIGYGSSGNQWIFELTPAGEYDKLARQINKAEIGDMPDFTSTMEMGLRGLLKSDAATRHMIIISDGDPPLPPPTTLQKFQDTKTSISTVAVFPHGGRDTEVLYSIANATGGRYYFPPDPTQLPKIFIKEAKTLRRSQVQERTFTPNIIFNHQILKGIDGFPELHGYVLTSPREDPRAQLLMAVPPRKEDLVQDEADLDPVLAVWRYGLGKTAAWTSDMTTRWGRDLVASENFGKIATQLITDISRTKKEQFLRVYTYVNGNEGVVVVEDFHPEESLLDLDLSVTSGEDFSFDGELRQVASRRYQATVPLQGQGRYQVRVSTERPGAQPIDGVPQSVRETAYGGFIVSYSPEYLKFESSPIVLREIAEQTGGVELQWDEDDEASDSLAETVFGRRKPKRTSQPVFDWVLMALACMIPVDIAIRRVQLDFSWMKKLLAGGKDTAPSTVGSLLQKTAAVRSSLKTSETERPARPTTPRTPVGPRPASASKSGSEPNIKPAESTPEPPAEDDGSTTSRLLAMKRRRDQEKNDN